MVIERGVKAKEDTNAIQTIDSRRQRGDNLSFGRAEQNGNEMAYALAVVGMSRAKTFKAWW